jgi:hypothetical protein
MAASANGLVRFRRDLRKFQALQARSHSQMRFGNPCIDDYGAESGTAAGHYFHQDLIVAQRIFKANPIRHVDVASRVDGFVAHLAVFREVEVFDIRPLTTSARNIVFRRCNIMAEESPNTSNIAILSRVFMRWNTSALGVAASTPTAISRGSTIFIVY